MLSLVLLAFTAAGSGPAIGIERFEVDARTSTIGFDGTSTLHDFTGKTHAITGDFRADAGDPARLVGGAVWIEARTLDTGNGSRDSDMRDVLDVSKYPQIVFRIDSVEGRTLSGTGELTAHGRFTIKGIEKSRVVHFNIEPLATPEGRSGHTLHVRGETRFDMSDHGVERPGILIAKVADEVRVWFDLTLVPVPDAGVDASARTLQVEEDFVPSAKDGAARKVSDVEYVWTSGDKRLWARRLAPVWIEADKSSLSTIDPATGLAQPMSEVGRQLMDRLSKPIEVGAVWSATVDEPGGKRTLRITFGEQVPARAPTWIFDPRSWANGPPPAAK
jgi:polyisoprenoid-binding protein YceI